MDTLEKIGLLAKDVRVEDPDERFPKKSCVSPDLPVFNAVVSGGRCIRLLKALQTTVCEKNCGYCGIRWGKDSRRVTFSPDEMAGFFLELYQSGACEGLFLSSGIARGGISSQDRIIATAEILRRRGYKGYMHLKIMPGADRDQVLRTMQLANRVSINLEAPTMESLAFIAPKKEAQVLFQPLQWVHELRRDQDPQRSWNGRWPSTSTQFVVGAAGESDRDYLNLAKRLRVEVGLTRIHYSPFDPNEGTPLAYLPPQDPTRTFRLYQADFLIRDYGFLPEELLNGERYLGLTIDPKMAFADRVYRDQPLEVNRAEFAELIRIPGIGPKTAKRILQARNSGSRIRNWGDLARTGASVKRSERYILLDGKQVSQQLRLF